MTYNINSLLPIAEEVMAGGKDDSLTTNVAVAGLLFKDRYPALIVPGWGDWKEAFAQVNGEPGTEVEQP